LGAEKGTSGEKKGGGFAVTSVSSRHMSVEGRNSILCLMCAYNYMILLRFEEGEEGSSNANELLPLEKGKGKGAWYGSSLSR